MNGRESDPVVVAAYSLLAVVALIMAALIYVWLS